MVKNCNSLPISSHNSALNQSTQRIEQEYQTQTTDKHRSTKFTFLDKTDRPSHAGQNQTV